jgi:diacylglycerol O-acyltransferase / wax synthase
MVRVMHHQRLVHLLLSNVPGPPVPLWFEGARVLELFQIGVLRGNVTLSVGALSYAGQLNIDIVADANACPDVSLFADGLGETLRSLGVDRA